MPHIGHSGDERGVIIFIINRELFSQGLPRCGVSIALKAFLAPMLGGWTTARTLIPSTPAKSPGVTKTVGRRQQPDGSRCDPTSRPACEAGIDNTNYQGM